MTGPSPDPVTAVTHPDPYPYYAGLVSERPLYRDDALGVWVASSADAVSAVLTSDIARVRPPAEPVPAALLGSPAAEIFRHLVRMNDGAGHCPFNRAVAATLESIAAGHAREAGRVWAPTLLGRPGSTLSGLVFDLPVYVVASLLGVPEARLAPTALWLGDFARGIARPGSPDQAERARSAAGHLLEEFRSLLGSEALPPGAALAVLAREARRVGRADTDVIVANGIGFMSQAYEATAGLIGNTLVALARRPSLREEVMAELPLLAAIVQEVLRFDPPVQNTRRFLARAGTVGGQAMNEGDAVLVLLAAANRDPRANPDPTRFDPLRAERRIFTFGTGPHACPGAALAATIATAGVEHVLEAGLDLSRCAGPMTYHASANVRIPRLDG